LKRLRRFLPQLEEANKVLEVERADGTLTKRIIDVHGSDEEEDESADEETSQPYIEMVCY